jgi:hypothetical protein
MNIEHICNKNVSGTLVRDNRGRPTVFTGRIMGQVGHWRRGYVKHIPVQVYERLDLRRPEDRIRYLRAEEGDIYFGDGGYIYLVSLING